MKPDSRQAIDKILIDVVQLGAATFSVGDQHYLVEESVGEYVIRSSSRSGGRVVFNCSYFENTVEAI